MLSLAFPGLRLTVEITGRDVSVPGAPYQDWLECQVSAESPGCETSFRWSADVAGLKALRHNLSQMHRDFPASARVSFRPAEPNIELTFEHRRGEYTLRPDFVDGPTITGHFGFDQSYVPGIVSAIDAFLAEADRAA
ncbi:MAG TPA: hypothetical protein VKG23_05825 [Thermoanaerobaculia bacterium]|nr:hypothetical protein [Thermoanaerobaculia bacterium]